MSRRDQRSGDGRRYGGRKKTLFQRTLALSLVWFDASGHITLSGTGDVLSVHDRKDDTHVLTQADTAKQVDPPAAHADFANQLCFTFTGAEWYQSNRAPGAWSQHHNGVGEQCVFTCTPTDLTVDRRPVSTRGPGATVGFNLASTAAGAAHYVHNGAALPVNLTGGALTVNVPTYLTYSYVDGRAPNEAAAYNRTTLILSTTTATVPSAADPAGSLVLGASSPTGLQPFVGRAAALMFFPPTTPDPALLVQQYEQQTFGIPP
jgi:hypothetical protein